MLGLFMFLTIVVELQWLTHAPIARVAETFYGDQLLSYSWLNIDSLALVYMIVFLILCLPASYIIDTYGIKTGIGIGAIIIPFLSDFYRKRKLLLVLCMIGIIPSIFGLAYAVEISSFFQLSAENTYDLALLSSFILGMSIMSAGPIVFQYTAEITAPTPESTSQGILLLVGQISGIIMVTLMSLKNNLYLDGMMKMFVPLAIVAFIAVLFIKESDIKKMELTTNAVKNEK